MPAVPRDIQPEMDWKGDDKVEAYKEFKHRIECHSVVYLSYSRQQSGQTTTDLDMQIKELVKNWQFKNKEEVQWKTGLFYHTTIYFEVCNYTQDQLEATLTYDRMIKKAKTMRELARNSGPIVSHRAGGSQPHKNSPVSGWGGWNKKSNVKMSKNVWNCQLFICQMLKIQRAVLWMRFTKKPLWCEKY